MPTKIADWLQNHKLSSHAIAGVLLGFFALYTTDTQFAQFVNSVVGQYPKAASALAVAAGIYLRYSTSEKGKP